MCAAAIGATNAPRESNIDEIQRNQTRLSIVNDLVAKLAEDLFSGAPVGDAAAGGGAVPAAKKRLICCVDPFVQRVITGYNEHCEDLYKHSTNCAPLDRAKIVGMLREASEQEKSFKTRINKFYQPKEIPEDKNTTEELTSADYQNHYAVLEKVERCAFDIQTRLSGNSALNLDLENLQKNRMWSISVLEDAVKIHEDYLGIHDEDADSVCETYTQSFENTHRLQERLAKMKEDQEALQRLEEPEEEQTGGGGIRSFISATWNALNYMG